MSRVLAWLFGKAPPEIEEEIKKMKEQNAETRKETDVVAEMLRTIDRHQLARKIKEHSDG